MPEDQPVALDRDRDQIVAESATVIGSAPPEVPSGPQELPALLPPNRLLGGAPDGAALRAHFHYDEPAIVLHHEIHFARAIAHIPLEQLEPDQLQVQGCQRLGGMAARHRG